MLSIFLSIYPTCIVQAETINSVENGLDIQFVMDVSGSMRGNDRSHMALEMVTALIDTIPITNVKVGFVAYNDKIVTHHKPVLLSKSENKKILKEKINQIQYEGNTDIGLGLTCAYEDMTRDRTRKQIFVLVSDGETDLGNVSKEEVQKAKEREETIVKQCKKNKIPIYSIAFGEYDGNKQFLTYISKETKGEMFVAKNPETFIQVLCSILNNNLSYKLQEVASGTYAKGKQEILYQIDQSHLNEVVLLLISDKNISHSTIQYGKNSIKMNSANRYAIGKIKGVKSDENIRIKTNTLDNQELRLYVVSYRNIVPKLEVDTENIKNKNVPFTISFYKKTEKRIEDKELYRHFQVSVSVIDEQGKENKQEIQYKTSGIGIHGNIPLEHSGKNLVKITVYDKLGKYEFLPTFDIKNELPTGNIPRETYTKLTKEIIYDLNQYFIDPDGDILEFSLEQNKIQEGISINSIEDGVLTIIPQTTGREVISITISDGNNVISYPLELTILPIWRAYWWIGLLLLITFIYFIRVRKSKKTDFEKLLEKNDSNQFQGKLNGYFTVQPETEQEIPPLSFPLFKIKSNRLNVADLFLDYDDAVMKLELNKIYLIPIEDRRMVLYHSSNNTIMIKNTIACKRTQYQVGFGDIIYITSQDGTYELELHYIAIIQ